MLPNNETQTQLIAAVWAGDFDIVKQLAIDTAMLHLRDPHGLTMVEIAASRCVWHRPNHHLIAKWLVDQGAVCDIFTASRAGLLDTVTKLVALSPGLVNAVDEEGRTPLMRGALVYGDFIEGIQVVDFLINHGAKPDVWSASTLAWPAVVELELATNAHLANERRQGATPIGWAVRPRRNRVNAAKVVEILIAADADVEAIDTDEEDMTPLMHVAEWSESTELVAPLLDAGANLNATNSKGWTALNYAQDRDRKGMVEYLLGLDAIDGRIVRVEAMSGT